MDATQETILQQTNGKELLLNGVKITTIQKGLWFHRTIGKYSRKVKVTYDDLMDEYKVTTAMLNMRTFAFIEIETRTMFCDELAKEVFHFLGLEQIHPVTFSSF